MARLSLPPSSGSTSLNDGLKRSRPRNDEGATMASSTSSSSQKYSNSNSTDAADKSGPAAKKQRKHPPSASLNNNNNNNDKHAAITSSAKGKGRARISDADGNADDDDDGGVGEIPFVSLEQHVAGDRAAAIKARNVQEKIKTAYQQLQERFDQLAHLRNTEVEEELDELRRLYEEKVESSQKMVQTYANETHQLRQQVADLKAAAIKAGDASTTTTTGQEDTAPASKHQNDSKIAAQEGGPSSPGGSSNVTKRGGAVATVPREEFDELQNARQELVEQLQTLRSEARAARREHSDALKALETRMAAQSQQEKLVLEKQCDKLTQDLETLQKMYDFEVQQSKALQAQAAASGVLPNAATEDSGVASTSNAQNGTSSGGNASTSTSASHDPAGDQALITLLSDLTGLAVIHRSPGTEKSTIYSFIMSDLKKIKHLHFKLITHPAEKKVDFVPDLQEGRDDVVIKSLDKDLQGCIKFDYTVLQTFFKRLWKSMNDSKR